MAHIRKQMRDWLKANLKGSLLAGNRVFIRRALPLEKRLQPTLLVAVQNERSTDGDMDGLQTRIVEVRVTACVKGDSEASEDQLDQLAVFVEEVFAGNPTMGGIAETFEYQATEFAFGGEGETTLATAALSFAVIVQTRRTDPQTSI